MIRRPGRGSAFARCSVRAPARRAGVDGGTPGRRGILPSSPRLLSRTFPRRRISDPPQERWSSLVVMPTTLLRWHRELDRRKCGPAGPSEHEDRVSLRNAVSAPGNAGCSQEHRTDRGTPRSSSRGSRTARTRPHEQVRGGGLRRPGRWQIRATRGERKDGDGNPSLRRASTPRDRGRVASVSD